MLEFTWRNQTVLFSLLECAWTIASTLSGSFESFTMGAQRNSSSRALYPYVLMRNVEFHLKVGGRTFPRVNHLIRWIIER